MTHKYPYGIIGNCAYLALIDHHASVDWLCLPRFDSAFLFGKLLDNKKGGQFAIIPENDHFDTRQSYVNNTNVLETYFETESGKFKVTDFAPRFANYARSFRPLMLIRKITPLEGVPRIKVSCEPVGEYGKKTPSRTYGSNHIRYMGLGQQVRLTTNIPLSYVDQQQLFVLNEPKYLVLTWGIPLEAALEETAEIFLKKTIEYWRDWVKNTTVEQFHQEAIIRSALTLKLHQYEDTGAIIAAATTSLPESPGSGRNWDYRFCWMRDTHYTLKALNDLSHFSELEQYASFIENIVVNTDDRLNPLYPITNDRIPKERIEEHLEGYQGNKPVRRGNQAYEHIQNDVYGQVLVTLLPLFNDKRLVDHKAPQLAEWVFRMLNNIERTMDEPDNGLWEFRGLRQKHCYTFLFHWAGSHAAYKMASSLGILEMQSTAARLIKESVKQIEACYDATRGVYTQAIGSPNLDASNLQLINMGYLDPSSERARKHLEVTEEALMAPGGLFYRYKHQDDFGEPESTFLICAFWYVEALARVGRLKDAIEIFNRLNSYSNHLGLLSEDVEAKTGSQWGNFPQTYSHVGLINAAFAISRKMDLPIFLSTSLHQQDIR